MRSSNTSKQVIVENYAKHIGSHSMITTPRYTKWIVTMWSFRVDTAGEYTGKEFEVTFGDGVSALYMIYTKRMKDGKNRDRSERQEHPNQEHVDAIVRKLLPDGHLVNPDKVKILWCCDSKTLNNRISNLQLVGAAND
ncbi:MAG: hypothetical protein WBL88_17595 [Nitrososphaeraceae archaeon]